MFNITVDKAHLLSKREDLVCFEDFSPFVPLFIKWRGGQRGRGKNSHS